MAVYYLDSSALLKRYRTEQGTQVLDYLFALKRPEELVVTSYLTSLEVEAVFARALKGRLLDREAYKVLVGRLADDLSQSIVAQPVSNFVVSDSIELVRRHALKAADAIHLATASRVRQAAAMETIFVTSDKELLSAARGERLESLDPQDPEAIRRLGQFREG